MKINELKEKRAGLITQSRAILDAADAEGRSILNADEQGKFELLENEIEDLGRAIEQRKNLDNLEAAQASIEVTAEVHNREVTRDSGEYRSAFLKAMAGAGLSPDESRALAIGTNSAGGFLATTTIEQQIVELRQELNWMRQAATTMTVGNQTAFAVESDVGTATYAAENAAIADDDHAFAQTSFFPRRLGRIMKISNQLLRFNGTFSESQLESYISNSFAKQFASIELQKFLVGAGSGSNEPTGIFNSATSGVDAAGTTAFTADEIIDLFYSVAKEYRAAPGAGWIFSPEATKILRKLKDSNNQYLLTPGLGMAPDTLLGKPMYESDYVAAVAADATPVGFGDLSYYYIVDFGGFEFTSLPELYAANDQVGVKGIAYNDGNRMLDAAFKVMTMASS